MRDVMRRSVFAAKGLRGAGFQPGKPTFTHQGSGQFTISPFNPLFTYTITANTGTITRVGASPSFTVNNNEAIATVTPAFGPVGTPALVERKPYEMSDDTRYTVHENLSECGPGPDCSCHPGFFPHWDYGEWPPGSGNFGSVNPHCSRDNYYGSAPALINRPGYTNSVNEWIKYS